MKKIAINTCYGGFDLSTEAELLYWQKKYPGQEITTNKDEYGWMDCFFLDDKQLFLDFYKDESREDPILIEVIETLGKKANSQYSNLEIVEIPDDVLYTIEDYDGIESVHEVHRVWR